MFNNELLFFIRNKILLKKHHGDATHVQKKTRNKKEKEKIK